jgi:hypothetical protein
MANLTMLSRFDSLKEVMFLTEVQIGLHKTKFNSFYVSMKKKYDFSNIYYFKKLFSVYDLKIKFS